MAFGAKGKGRPRNPNQQNALFKRKKFCRFTVDHVDQIDYKDIDTLRDFIQESLQNHALPQNRNERHFIKNYYKSD